MLLYWAFSQQPVFFLRRYNSLHVRTPPHTHTHTPENTLPVSAAAVAQLSGMNCFLDAFPHRLRTFTRWNAHLSYSNNNVHSLHTETHMWRATGCTPINYGTLKEYHMQMVWMLHAAHRHLVIGEHKQWQQGCVCWSKSRADLPM